MSSPYPIIHINGFPGTGKLTIAKALTATLASTTKLVHNHLLIDPAGAVLERTQPGYQDLRRAIRSTIFEPLIHNPATYQTAYIFTDFQSTDAEGSAVCKEYEVAAIARKSAFVSIVLSCEESVNMERLVSGERRKHGKLVDVGLAGKMREKSEIHKFVGSKFALELDVTEISVEVAVSRVLDHLRRVCPELNW